MAKLSKIPPPPPSKVVVKPPAKKRGGQTKRKLYNVEEEDVNAALDEVDIYTLDLGELRLYYQAQAEKQKFLATKVRNLRANGELVKNSDVESVIVSAFKEVSNYLDNLPDILERDGYIEAKHVEPLMGRMDEMREQLTKSLSTISKRLRDGER